MNTADRELIRRFLELQYGTTDRGTAYIGTKATFPFDNAFQWPEQAEEVVNFVATVNESGHDVWFAAHLFWSPKAGRAMGQTAKRRRLHFDIDRTLTAEDSAKLAELHAWLVYSGTPGHVHAYIELNRSVDVGTYHRLEDQLVAHFGSDPAVCRDNGLLRIPGTINRKPAPKGGPVLWDGYVSEHRWVPEELATCIGLDLSVEPQATAQVASSAPIVAAPVSQVPQAVQYVLDNPKLKSDGTWDRSAMLATIVNAAASAGLTIGQTLGIALSRPELVSKGENWIRNDIARVWAKFGGDSLADEESRKQMQDEADTAALMGGQLDAFATKGSSPPAPTTAQWDEIDLSYMFADDYRPLETTLLIRDDEIGLLYAGKSHSFQGISESGKSWIALWAVVEQIRLGHRVMYIDYEMGPAQTLDNLRAFGITSAELQLFSYRQWETSPPVEYLKSLTGYTLIVIDATTACLSTMGLSGSDNDDIAKWFTRFVDPLKYTGAAVSIIDHLTKAAEDAGTYAIGAQSKRALADVSFAVKMTQQMARGRHGELEVRVVKDRPGWIRQHCPEQTKTPVAARFQMVSDEAGNLTVKVEAPTLQQKVDAVQSMVETFALLGMPTDYGRTRAERFLAEHDVNGVRTETLTDALRNYKARAALEPE
ncbi:hypothetical protein ACU5JM_31690 [Rhodococcus erythropolis]|uniref:hypothetical protein n=1 Tax=Rhodococcus erythropolis TaxID=1833 RepID=UPI00406BA0E4